MKDYFFYTMKIIIVCMNDYDNVYETTMTRLHKVRAASNELKYRLSGIEELDYPKITEAGRKMKNAQKTFIKQFVTNMKRKEYKNIETYNEDMKEITKKSRLIGKEIKNVLKRDLDLRLFSPEVHKGVVRFYDLLTEVADIMISV